MRDVRRLCQSDGTSTGPRRVRAAGQRDVGWNEGLLGIRQGGRRLVVIPPEDAYGSTGQAAIGPDETLVFVVDAVAVAG